MQTDPTVRQGAVPGTGSTDAQAAAVSPPQSARGDRARRPAEVLRASCAAWSAVALVALLLILTAAVAARWSPLMGLDRSVTAWAHDVTSQQPATGPWWTVVDRYSEPILLRIIMVVLAGVLASRRRWALAGWLVGVAVVENFAAPYSKYILDRPRPHWPHPLVVEDTTSFPAGHAAGVATFALAIVLVALVTLSAPAARLATIGFSLLLVAVICLDRIFLGLHYVSDVVGGLLLGAAVPLLGWAVMLRLTGTDDG